MNCSSTLYIGLVLAESCISFCVCLSLGLKLSVTFEKEVAVHGIGVVNFDQIQNNDKVTLIL